MIDTDTLIAALTLAAVHLVVPALWFLHVRPRSRWLSFAGGVSVGYVFVHILPTLGEGQAVFHTLDSDADLGLPPIKHHVYVLALFGLAFFYVVERLAMARGTLRGPEWEHAPRTPPSQPAEPKQAGQPTGERTARETPSPEILWVHLASYGLYNALIGFLLLEYTIEVPESYSLLFFTVAMGLHFLVTDHGLYAHHERTYSRIGRWALAACVLFGWSLGQAVALPDAVRAGLFAFLVGSVILNVMKEELPPAHQSRAAPFLVGAFGYAALWLFFV